MKSIIMAGGEGTRLRPLTCSRPKPMVPIMNKPVMEHIINLLKKHSIVDIGVTLQYMPEAIKDFFGDGSEYGVNISYFVEDKPLGTAGSVKNAQEFLDDTFLVISGDALTDIDLTKAIEFHKKKHSIATLVLTKVEVPLEYGVVVTENDGRIKGFLEKPSWSEVFSDTVNTGIYVLEPQCLSYFDAGQVFDFSNDLFPIILNKGLPMYGYVTKDYWCDVGDLKAYQACHFDILDGKVKINIPGYQIQGKIWVDEGVEIDKDCIISGPVVIGANCKIKKGAKIESYCVLGNGNILEESASLKKTILLNGCTVGSGSQLRGTIICNKVNIKENCSIFEQSVVGDNAFLSENVQVKPNIKVWPNKFIDYGCDINANLIWGTKYTKNIFGKKGIAGRLNSELTTEFMSKLGSAFAEVFKKNSKLGVSYDNSSISSMLKSSFIAGIMSIGAEVYDLGQMILPITRDAVKFYMLDGGVHICLSSDNHDINIYFMDKNGINITKNVERKIENLFCREDFLRCDIEDVKDVRVITNYRDYYIRSLINSVKFYNIRTMNYKLLLNIRSELVRSVIQSLMTELNCQYQISDISIMNTSKKDSPNLNENINCFADQVKLDKCDLGILIENSSEEMTLIDDKGQIIDEDMFTAIITLITLTTTKGETVIVPHSAPSVIDKLAVEYGGQVLRTKTAVQDIMTKMITTRTVSNAGNQFRLKFDSIAGLVKILDFMAQNNLKLSQLVNMIPSYHMSKKNVECPWDSKGKVMRELIEDNSGKKVELLEGVKIYKDGGWVLVLPDAEKPLCRVISEGYTQEFAESLTDMYVNKISNISIKDK